MKEHIRWIDIAKVIGIYLMIVGHRQLLEIDWTVWIYTFHMPLFFIIAGINYHPTSVEKELRKVFRSLIIPFLIITSCHVVLSAIECVIGQNSLNNVVSGVVGSLLSPGKNIGQFHPLCVPLWFLVALSIIRIGASVIRDERWLLIVSSIGLVIDVIISKGNIILPFAIDSALLAYPFFAIGYFFSSQLKRNTESYISGIIIILCVIIVTVCKKYNGYVDIATNQYGECVLLYILGGLAGSLMVMHLSKLIDSGLRFNGGGIVKRNIAYARL